MSDFESVVLRAAVVAVRDRMEEEKRQLILGFAHSFDQYRERVGVIRSFEETLEILKEVEKRVLRT